MSKRKAREIIINTTELTDIAQVEYVEEISDLPVDIETFNHFLNIHISLVDKIKLVGSCKTEADLKRIAVELNLSKGGLLPTLLKRVEEVECLSI